MARNAASFCEHTLSMYIHLTHSHDAIFGSGPVETCGLRQLIVLNNLEQFETNETCWGKCCWRPGSEMREQHLTDPHNIFSFEPLSCNTLQMPFLCYVFIFLHSAFRNDKKKNIN